MQVPVWVTVTVSGIGLSEVTVTVNLTVSCNCTIEVTLELGTLIVANGLDSELGVGLFAVSMPVL